MYVYKGKSPKVILVFDFFLHKNLKKFEAKNPDLTVEDLYYALINNFNEYLDVLSDFNPEDLIIISLFSSDLYSKSNKYFYKEIDKSLRYDLFTELVGYEDCIIMTFGKYSLYALTKLKEMTKHIGKEKYAHFSLPELKLNLKYKVIPNYSIQYVKMNRFVLPEFRHQIKLLASIVYDLPLEYKLPDTKVFIDELEALNYLNSLIKNKDISYVFFDIETESLSLSKVLGVSIDYEGNDTPVYIPVLSLKVKEKISELLKTKQLVGHNFQFDLKMLVYNGFINYEDVSIKADTSIMSHLIFNDLLHTTSLKKLAKKLLFAPDWEQELDDFMLVDKDLLKETFLKYFPFLDFDVFISNVDLTRFDKKKIREFFKNLKQEYPQLKMKTVDQFLKDVKRFVKTAKEDGYQILPVEILGKYASLDAYFTKELYFYMLPRMKDSYWNVMNGYTEALKLVSSWSLYGTKINRKFLDKVDKYLIDKISGIYSFIINIPEVKEFYLKYRKLNLSSYDQLSILFKDFFKIKKYKKTKSGLVSLKDEDLEYIKKHLNEEKDKNVLVFLDLFSKYKELEKIKDSYVKKLKQETNELGIFYPDYKICGTKTGRLSSFFHTLPTKTDLGKLIKSTVEPKLKENLILSFDLKTLEPRILASLSGDEALISIFRDGYDLYRYIASKVFKKPYENITSEERNKMKVLVLAISYGMTSSTLAEKLKITKEEAETIINSFYKEFSKVQTWQEDRIYEARRYRIIRTALGREIPIPLATDKEIHRIAVNYPIQSTASEMALFMFTGINNYLKKYNLKAHSFGGVHDSLLIEINPNDVVKAIQVTNLYLKGIVPKKFPFIKVPIEVEFFLGISWGKSLEVKDFSKSQLVLEGFSSDFISVLEKFYSKNRKVKGEIIDYKPVELSEISLLNYNSNVKYIQGKIHLGGD